MSRRSSPLSAASLPYLEHLYRRFRAEPDGLDSSWRVLFEVLDLVGGATGLDMLAALPGERAGPNGELAEVLRSRGHLLARLNPLDDSAADAEQLMRQLRPHVPPPAGDVAACYLGPLSVETAHIDDPALRHWLIRSREAEPPPRPPNEQVALLHDLIRAEEFERFLGRKYPTKKRFGAEGAEAVLLLLRHVLRRAAANGVTHAVIGTMHRGRLNLSVNAIGRPLTQVLAEVAGAHPFPADPPRPGDVPYHLAHHGTLDTGAGCWR